jgi:hypothetical protein
VVVVSMILKDSLVGEGRGKPKFKFLKKGG